MSRPNIRSHLYFQLYERRGSFIDELRGNPLVTENEKENKIISLILTLSKEHKDKIESEISKIKYKDKQGG